MKNQRERLDDRKLCAKILSAKQICELCLNANSTEVHIITYPDGETLFRALCYECHKITIKSWKG